MATLEQLAEGIKRAHAAGDAENVRILGQAYRQMQSGVPAQPSASASPGAYEDALADASRRSQFFSAGPTAASRYQVALRNMRESQFPDMSDEQWREYSAKFLGPYDRVDLAQQSQTFGFGDEINAGLAGIGAQARQLVGGGVAGFGDAYDQAYELEQARLAYGREREGPMGTAFEILGGAATMGPARTAVGALAPQVAQTGGRVTQAARTALPVMAEGAAYGFGSTDGDLGQRALGAGVGAGAGVVGAAAAPIVGKVIQGTARQVAKVPVNIANRRAAAQAVKSAPSAADIKATSQSSYRAAEATGATIPGQAMQGLAQDMTNLARLEGLVLPNGELSDAFPKVANAIRAVRQYGQGQMTMEQAQTLLKTLRTAQKSADPDEARVGNMMVNAYEDFFESLTPSAFGNINVVRAGLAAKAGQNPGREAIEQWTKARSQWARSKRTQSIEDIIADARLYRGQGGFAEGVRAGFAKVLKAKNAKARRGFSAADLQAMEDFVAGGTVKDLLSRIGSGAGLPGSVAGGLTGGIVGAVAVPTAGVLARKETNRQARKAVEQLRAQVATPGGIPMRTLPPPLPMPPGLSRLGGGATNIASGNDIRAGMPMVPPPLPRLPGR